MVGEPVAGAVSAGRQVVVYAAVSSADQRADLDHQVARVTLVRDVTEILTSLCARLYGRRAAANRAQRAVDAVTLDGLA